MKKTEAMKKILGTYKVAYNIKCGIALWAKGYSYINSVKSTHDGIFTEADRVDRRVNIYLLTEGWEVTGDNIVSLNEWEFPEEMVEISTVKMSELLIKNPTGINCECLDDEGCWEKVRIEAVNGIGFLEVYEYAGCSEVLKNTSSTYGYTRCRVSKKLLQEAALLKEIK